MEIDRNEVIRQRRNNGERIEDIARDYGVSHQRISQIVRAGRRKASTERHFAGAPIRASEALRESHIAGRDYTLHPTRHLRGYPVEFVLSESYAEGQQVKSKDIVIPSPESERSNNG